MRRRRLDPFDRRSMGLSAALHAALFALAWASTLHEPTQIEFLTYEIELVSPPAAPAPEEPEPQPPAEELVVERPDPEPTPPEPEVEEIVPVEEPEREEPEPEPEREEPAEEQPPEPAEEPVVTTAPEEVEEEPEETGEGLNVRMEGLQRDYPQYYDNIIRQIYRCFRWRDGGNWRTVVRFDIDREGNVDGLEFVQRSGNSAFDFEAMGAVECAGRGRFGPLPEDLPYDRQPIIFEFRPAGEDAVVLPALPDNLGPAVKTGEQS